MSVLSGDTASAPGVRSRHGFGRFSAGGLPEKPNNGFLLRTGDQIVGAIGAIYSQQDILGREELLCNLTSWYVLPDYRKFSLALFLALVRQKGYHFTTFTANPTVVKLLLGAGFNPLPQELIAVPNLALPAIRASAVEVWDTPETIAQVLSHERRRICVEHADCVGIRQLAVGIPGEEYSHILYNTGRCRHLPCALLLDVSDGLLLQRFWRHVSAYLLFRAGCLVTRIESRLVAGCRLPYAIKTLNGAIDLFCSASLESSSITPLYSEVMALRGC